MRRQEITLYLKFWSRQFIEHMEHFDSCCSGCWSLWCPVLPRGVVATSSPLSSWCQCWWLMSVNHWRTFGVLPPSKKRCQATRSKKRHLQRDWVCEDWTREGDHRQRAQQTAGEGGQKRGTFGLWDNLVVAATIRGEGERATITGLLQWFFSFSFWAASLRRWC